MDRHTGELLARQNRSYVSSVGRLHMSGATRLAQRDSDCIFAHTSPGRSLRILIRNSTASYFLRRYSILLINCAVEANVAARFLLDEKRVWPLIEGTMRTISLQLLPSQRWLTQLSYRPLQGPATTTSATWCSVKAVNNRSFFHGAFTRRMHGTWNS